MLIRGSASTTARVMTVRLVGVEGSPFVLPRRQNWTVIQDVRDKVTKILIRDAELAAANDAEIPWYGRVDFVVVVVKDLVRGNYSVTVRGREESGGQAKR